MALIPLSFKSLSERVCVVNLDFYLTKFSTSMITRRNRRLKLTQSPLHIPNGNFVSIIGFWIRNVGIGSEATDRSMRSVVAISITCFVFTTISQVIALFKVFNDREKLFECFSVLSFCVMGLLKLHSLRGSHERWHSLLSSASDLECYQLANADPMQLEYESDNEEDLTFHNHIKKYTRKFLTTSTLLSRIYTFTGFVHIISPFIEYVIKVMHGAEQIVEYPHILPGWAPLDKLSKFGYIITVSAEGIAAVYCVCVHVAFDLSVVGMMIYIHGQFLLLHEYCERIGDAGVKYRLSPRRDLRAHIRIAKCHRIHVSLIKSVKEISSLSENILGIYFNLATLTLCSVAVQLTHGLSTTQLITSLQYMSATLTQLVLFCNYGDAVINESAVTLGVGPSASTWWCFSPRIRREVALLCVGMTRRYDLLAKPFHSVNLPAFIQILRTAYSYYALVRQKSGK